MYRSFHYDVNRIVYTRKRENLDRIYWFVRGRWCVIPRKYSLFSIDKNDTVELDRDMMAIKVKLFFSSSTTIFSKIMLMTTLIDFNLEGGIKAMNAWNSHHKNPALLVLALRQLQYAALPCNP